MQPNFTLTHRGFIFKIVAVAMIFVLSSRASFSQQARPSKPVISQQSQQLRLAKQSFIQSQSNRNVTSNDAGLTVNTQRVEASRTEAICTTYTGELAAGDPTLPGPRMFRDGIPSTCAVPKPTCPGTSGAAGNWYDTYSFTNGQSTPQCLTIVFNNTSAAIAQFISAHLGSFDPTNICTNYIADAGSSPAAAASITFSFTIPASATVVFAVTGLTAGTGGTYNFTVDGICAVAPPCSGTPNPGNTLASAPTVCPNINFTLNPQNATAGSGVTYVWQSAPSSTGPWTNVTGGTGASLTTTQNAATWYRVTVTCGANSGTSTPVLVNLTSPASCYCTPTYASGCALGDFIARVRVGTLDNTSVCSTPPFTYYSALPAPVLIAGGTYPVTVNVGPDTFGQNVGIWVDFNMNGSFNDAGEFIGQSGNVGANGVAVINLVIPPTATTGTTRMRIRGGDDVAMTAAQSCGASNSAFGEAEDYNIQIDPCVQGVVTVQPANTTLQCSGNGNISFTATGSALAYSWEYRTSPTGPWLVLPTGSVFSTQNTNSLTLTNVTSGMNGWQFRGVFSGPCTAVDFTTPATLTVGPLVAQVNPTSASICAGSVQALQLTNASFPATTTYSSGPLNILIPDLNGPPVHTPAVVNAGINHSINVPLAAGTVISRIDVRLNISHSYVADLLVVLQAPNGRRLNLSYHKAGTGTAGADYTNTVFSSTGTLPVSGGVAPGYTGLWRADASIGAGSFGDITGSGPTGFAPTHTTFPDLWGAQPVGGNWTIAIADPQEWAGDQGTLTSWSMDITYGAAAAGVWTSAPAAPNTMFTDPAATVPYVAGTPVNTVYVKPATTTTYSVVYSTSTPCVSAPTNVTVNVVNPVGTVTQPANRSGCVNGSATFTASATGGPNTYQWQVSTDGGVTYNNVPGATASSLTVSNLVATMNNYRYRVQISASPCAGTVTSNAAVLTVNPLPTVTLTSPDLNITPGQTTTLTTTSNPAAAPNNGFVYTLNGNVIPGSTNTQVVNVNGLGAYQVKVTDVNGCVNTSAVVTVGAEASDRLWIYPNPTPGAFQVRLFYGGTVAERRVVSIFDAAGKLVMNKEFTLLNTSSPYLQMDFDLSHLAGGTYVVKVDNRHTGNIVSGLVILNHD